MEPLRKLDIPIDVDNEAIILSNALKNDKLRELFSKTVDYLDFQYKENQVLSWTIQELQKTNLNCNIDTILVKSLSCPVKYKIDYEYVSQITQNFSELPEDNFRIHITKLKTDKVKQELSEFYFKSIYSACLDPHVDINYLETRINYAKDIIQKNGSSGVSQFLTLETMMDNFLVSKSQKSDFKSTGFPALDDKLTDGYKAKGLTIICGLAGMGKSFCLDTLVLMYDGTYKKVQDVVKGDLVMGVDSTSRKVVNTHVVRGTRHVVKQTKGTPYVVNEQHLLQLVVGENYGDLKKGDKFTISTQDFVKKRQGWQAAVNGYKVGVEFNEQSLPVDPYYLGLWLGDGTSSNTDITSCDEEIINYIKDFHILNNKHIPQIYKINSRENRLKLLAGLIDSDGNLNEKKGGRRRATTFEISSKFKELADDITFLARSLGFYTTCNHRASSIKSSGFTGMYWNITISGDVDEIPVLLKRKKADSRKERYSCLVSRLHVTVEGEDTFYGFELDGDHLFLLEDFTVAHNSSFVLSSMYNLSNTGIWCPQFALEMDSMAVSTKLASFSSGISVKRIAKEWNNFTELEKKLIDYEIHRLKKNPYILCNDTPGQSLQSIREQVLILQDRLKTEYMFVSIDLFGKIKEFQTSDNFARNYEQELNKTQVLAKELGVNLGLVAQINRAVMSRKFTRPKMSDLKNAGAWEEVGDLMLGVHRPFYDPEKSLKSQIEAGGYDSDYNKGHKDENDDELYGDMGDPTQLEENMAEIIVMKQRMGEGNTITNCIFDPNTTRYVPLAQADQMYVNLSKKSLSAVG